MGNTDKYKARHIFRKTNISYPLIRTRPYAYQGGLKFSFFGKFGVLCFLGTPVLKFASETQRKSVSTGQSVRVSKKMIFRLAHTTSIKFSTLVVLFLKMGVRFVLFHSFRKLEQNNELLKLLKTKSETISMFSLIILAVMLLSW